MYTDAESEKPYSSKSSRITWKACTDKTRRDIPSTTKAISVLLTTCWHVEVDKLTIHRLIYIYINTDTTTFKFYICRVRVSWRKSKEYI